MAAINSTIRNWSQLSNLMQSLDDVSGRIMGPIAKSETSLIFMVMDGYQSTASIMKYNENNDTAQELCTIYIGSMPSSLVYYQPNNSIYFTRYNGIYSINLTTKEMNASKFENGAQYGFYHKTTLAIIDTKLHIFGYKDDQPYRTKHTIYDIDTDKIETHDISLPLSCYLRTHSMIFIKSQAKVLFFGGSLDENIMIYDINKHTSEILLKLPINPQIEPKGIITRDDKYVMLFYGYHQIHLQSPLMFRASSHKSRHYKVLILDVDNKFSKKVCDVTYPHGFDTDFVPFIIDNTHTSNIIITGYIRRCLYEQFPDELVDVVIQYYRYEYVHLVNVIGEHCRIYIDDIFQASRDCKDSFL